MKLWTSNYIVIDSDDVDDESFLKLMFILYKAQVSYKLEV